MVFGEREGCGFVGTDVRGYPTHAGIQRGNVFRLKSVWNLTFLTDVAVRPLLPRFSIGLEYDGN